MAIRKRSGGGKSYQVYWNNPFTGKRQSLCFATQSEAQKHDSLIKHQLKFDREVFRQSNEELPHEKRVEEVYYLYLKEKRFSKKGLSAHLTSTRLLLGLLGAKPIKDVTADDLILLKETIKKTGVKGVTIRNNLSVARTLFRWAEAEGQIDNCPKMPSLPPANYEKLVPPTRAEISAMMNVADPHVQRVIVLGSQIGLRVGSCEMFKLQWKDIDLSERVVRVESALKNPNEQWREVPIRESLLVLFESWKNEDLQSGIDYVVNYNGKQITSIKHAWATTLARAGIERRIRPYDLRHAFATEMIAAGVDIGTTAKLMGHSSAQMVLKHYQHVMDSQKRNAVEALPDVIHVPNPMCQKNKGFPVVQ